MKSYLVGGAVRDELLGLPVHERDYVVVGATEEEMKALGYRSVGKDFPVYLHPDTGYEYALARTERKTGPGHTGFECETGPEVTLEEDLQRRDLTINALAQDDDGTLIDPCDGLKDIDDRVLRHISRAFTEDPLRVLRVARFRARLHHLGFEVHPDTHAMLKHMVAEGQIQELTAERVQGELNKALKTTQPEEFFIYLKDIGAHDILWPEISDSIIEKLAALPIPDPDTRLALLLMDLSADEISQFAKRLKLSNDRKELAQLVTRFHQTWARLHDLTAEEVVALLVATDAFRKSDRFNQFNQVCEAILGGSLADRWRLCQFTASEVRARDLATDATGPALGAAVRAEQVRRIRNVLQ
jgi:tRNA nucleotidyltransferase (CCA-adding enzyme)